MTREEQRSIINGITRAARVALALAALAVAVLLLSGCGPLSVADPSAAPAVGTDLVITVMGRHVAGCHACPVGPSRALTAAHCVDPSPLDPDVPFETLWGESPNGWAGELEAVNGIRGMDLATLRPADTPFASWYTRRVGPPPRGEAVTVVGFSRDKRDPLGRRVVRGEVTSAVAHHLALSAFAGFGSSGGCVLDSRGELVGIVSAAMAVGKGVDEKYATVAVGVWRDE